MRDIGLLIVSLGAILVSVCSTNLKSADESDYDEPVRMASESLVVKSYKEGESSTVATTSTRGDRLEEYQVYQGVMGRPGIDFPVYPYIPATNFNCRKVKKSGYYADLATDCQVFHICDGNRKISFLCPNGTIFRQSHLICDWWFRVDCRKSVELYEESAEQLAADQKIYKARSEEREKRRKHGKSSTGENGGELTSSEVYALDEPFHIKGRKSFEQAGSSFPSTTTRTPLRFDGRKSERHSKKVKDSGSTEKFSNYNRERQIGRGGDKTRSKERQEEVRQFSTPTPITTQPKVSFVNNRNFSSTTPVYSTPIPVIRYQQQNNFNFESNKENIQPAESGSLVEDLSSRERNNAAANNNANNNNYNYNVNQNKNNNLSYNTESGTKAEVLGTTGQNNAAYSFNNNYNAKTSEQNLNNNEKIKNTGFSYNIESTSLAGDLNIRQQNKAAYNLNQNNNNKDRSNSFSYNSESESLAGNFNNGERNVNNNYNQKTDQSFTSNNKNKENTFSYNTEFIGSNKDLNIREHNKAAYNLNNNYSNKRTEQGFNYNNSNNKNRGQNTFFQAESESLVTDSNDRGRNNADYTNNQKKKVTEQGFEYNNKNINNNYSFNNNNQRAEYQANAGVNSEASIGTGGLVRQTTEANNREWSNNYQYINNNNNQRSEIQTVTISSIEENKNPAYNAKKGSDNTFKNNNKGENAQFFYTAKVTEQVVDSKKTYDQDYNDKKTEKAFDFGKTTNSAYDFNEQTESADVGVTGFTTEYINYESKRTNPIERHETVTPTFFSKKTQSSRYRSTTTPYVEHENQFLAETASFASNRGAKSYTGYQNQFNTFQQNVATTSSSTYKTTFYQTPKPTEGFFSSTVQKFGSSNNNVPFSDFYQTTTQRPIKQNSRKVTVFPSTYPQTTLTNRIWQTTTFPSFTDGTTINDKFTVDDVYFTTSTPEKDFEIIGRTQEAEINQKQSEHQTISDYFVTTPKPEVDITLQELNINRGFQSTESNNKSYEDFVREGLEVPPSSGPNALRSFALYFATNNNNNEEILKTTQYLPVTEAADFTTTLSPFEIKKKEVVKQVDELVQRSSVNTSEHDIAHNEEELPNSLTLHTKDSYSALFAGSSAENNTGVTVTDRTNDHSTVTELETTAFESFTEEPYKINKELTKNDLDGSQSRGLVEPDPHAENEYRKVSPDLRELAQVFTKALSAYLDDPEAFRKVLSEIRPTEPTTDTEVSSGHSIDFPSATQEEDEVLDFSDVTKATYKKKTSTFGLRETTTEFFTESPTTTPNYVENFVVPLNQSSWATNIELTAPLFESLDQSQSSYYTPPPFSGTTNAIAEEINNGFSNDDKISPTDSNETVDSYLPIRGSVDDSSLPRYGGFQNNTKSTTKYTPYGAELTSSTYLPYGADLTSTPTSNTAETIISENKATTFSPVNETSFFSHFSKNESEEGEIQLAKELNNLILLQKFTTPRGAQRETTTESNLATSRFVTQNDIIQYQDSSRETQEHSNRGGKSLHFPESDINSNYFEPNPKEINLELSPPSSTPKGFLITYSLGESSGSEPATYLPKATTAEIRPTTYSPSRLTTVSFAPETSPQTSKNNFDSVYDATIRSVTEFFTTIAPTTISFSKSTKSLDRITQLQETLMFSSNNITNQQKNQARVSVEEMMEDLNMTDSTANTLMKVMEMAAKNETYRRLVLLLVNDKSGRNKTVEEARLSLLKALLTPVINPQHTRTSVPIPDPSKLVQTEPRQRTGARRSKSIHVEKSQNQITTTQPTTTSTQRRTPNEKNIRRVKASRELARAESSYSNPGLGNLGLIKRTIENSKNKQVRVNSVDDAILDSDSRAVELLRSLYSLAARWG